MALKRPGALAPRPAPAFQGTACSVRTHNRAWNRDAPETIDRQPDHWEGVKIPFRDDALNGIMRGNAATGETTLG